MSIPVNLVRREVIETSETLVVKVGTNVISRPDATLDVDRIATLVEAVVRIRETGRKVVIVSSGAVGAGIDVLELNHVGTVPVYVDGADEIDAGLRMIKGGGAALTREKIVAACAERFICIADASKRVEVLGGFPLPVEVIPMARSYVAREMVKLGITPVYRDGVLTDNGNRILDGYDKLFDEPEAMEAALDAIVGVVTNGLFARRPADVLLLGGANGVERFTR